MFEVYNVVDVPVYVWLILHNNPKAYIYIARGIPLWASACLHRLTIKIAEGRAIEVPSFDNLGWSVSKQVQFLVFITNIHRCRGGRN